MNYQYYATEWVVHPVSTTTLHTLFCVAGRLQCLLYQQGSRRHESGYYVISFVLRVPTSDTLNQFVHEVGVTFGLTNWKQVTPEEFHGAPFIGSRIGGFVVASQIYGHANADLHRRNNPDTDENALPALK